MYMAVALLVWAVWIIKLKYEVRSRRYENASGAYLAIMSRSVMPDGIFFYRLQGTGYRLQLLNLFAGFALC